MIQRLQKSVLRLMKVPAEPDAPEGSAGSAQVFRAGRNYYRFLLVLWCVRNLLVLALITVAISAAVRRSDTSPQWTQYVVEAVAVFVVTAYLVSAFVTFFELRMNYELRWYVVTDRCLRVRSGILNVHEITMTFANIQEVRLSAGPFQKLLGLADVEVQSAGGGGSKRGSSDSHVARFEGVDNASEIRDFILARLRQYRDSGLGEKDHAHPPDVAGGSEAAAQAVLKEVRALRAALAQR